MSERKSNFFGLKLKAWIEAQGRNPHQVAVDAKILPPTLYNILAGRIGASPAVVAKLSQLGGLDIPFEKLRAWRAADEIGPDDLWLIYAEAPEIFAELAVDRGEPGSIYGTSRRMTPAAIAAEVARAQASQGAPATLNAAAAAGDIARGHEHLTGPGIRPLTDREWRYVDELLAVAGGDLGQVSLYKGAPVWHLDEDERPRALQQLSWVLPSVTR